MHQLIDKKKKILIYLLFLIILSTTNNKSLEIQKNYLVTINTINVSGLSNDKNLKITSQLNNLLFRNIFFIDKNYINLIISEYDLVEKYSVKKIYPKQVNIEIEPTKYIAEIKGSSQFLIGSNGKLIKNEYTNEPLPLFFGKFNSKKFLEFKKLIEKSEFEFKDFRSIFFYFSNRWDVQTTDGILIKLPKQNLTEALRIAHKIIKNDQFQDERVIDLRISNHVIMKNEE
jgi:cell division protein FtsQ